MALARLFAWLDRVLGGGAAPGAAAGLVSPVAGATGASAMSPAPRPARVLHPAAALLSVDGGGQVLLIAAERVTLGHLRAGCADLGFLADVGALHAALLRADSLQAGPGWRIVPLGAERVAVAGEPVPESGRRLASEERVHLGENLEFRMEVPDAASATVVLELLRGAECAGARRILLLAPGPGGRMRIGAALHHHVRVPGLAFELELEWHAHELRLRSEAPLAGAVLGTDGALPFPPPERLELTAGAARGSRPPFALSFEPVERGGSGGA